MVVVDDVRDPVLDVLDRAARRCIESKPARAGTLCMKNFEPKLPPAATGTTFSLLAGIFSAHGDQPQEVREVHRVGVDRHHARAGVVVADRAVGLHRHAGGARPVELRLHAARRVRERLVDLAEA